MEHNVLVTMFCKRLIMKAISMIKCNSFIDMSPFTLLHRLSRREGRVKYNKYGTTYSIAFWELQNVKCPFWQVCVGLKSFCYKKRKSRCSIRVLIVYSFLQPWGFISNCTFALLLFYFCNGSSLGFNHADLFDVTQITRAFSWQHSSRCIKKEC